MNSITHYPGGLTDDQYARFAGRGVSTNRVFYEWHRSEESSRQPDPELVSWHDQLWAESVAIIEATCQRTAMEAKAHYTRKLLPGTLVFAKSEDAHAYIRRMARRS